MKSDLSEAFNFGPDFTFELINVSENQTFRIDCADGRKFALRLARPRYHTADEFASEMAWIEALAAQLHNHAVQWNRPNNFTRPRWDFQATLGSEMRWGDWHNGLGVKPYMLPILSRTVNEVEQRLKVYGESEQRFNLI